MRKLLLITVLLFISKVDSAQSLNLDWGAQIGGSDIEWGHQVETDKDGSVYSIGMFRNTIDFDPTVGIFTMTAPVTKFNAFIQKLDSNGNFIWAKKIGDSATVFNSITIGNMGSIYLGGVFSGTVDFDPGISSYSLSSTVNVSFILKLDNFGNFIWVKTFNTTVLGGASIGDIQFDQNNNLYVTGALGNTTDFDPGVPVFTLSNMNPGTDLFIAKYDSNANFIWAKGMLGTGSMVEYGMDIDTNGNVYIIGYYSGTIDFDPGPALFNMTYTGAYQEIFISKLDSSGDFVWAKQLVGNSSNTPTDILIHNSSTIYVVCNFFDTLDCDPGALVNNIVSLNGRELILKLDVNGNFIWAKQIGAGTNFNQASAMALDNFGNLFIAGKFHLTADVDPGTSVYNVSSPTVANLFILKMDVNGSFVWAKQIESNGGFVNADDIISMRADSQSVYLLGRFQAPIDIDPGLATFNLATLGYVDLFVLKLKQCLSSSSILKPTACESYTINGQTYTTSGVYAQHDTSSTGCDSILTITLTIDTLPNNTVLQTGVTLTALATSATYKWINCVGNTLISGATNQSYTATANGMYAVIITTGSCMDTSSCYTVNGLSINEYSTQDRIQVIPNPTSGKFAIQSINEVDQASLRLFEITGNMIFEIHNLTGSLFSLDISKQAKGLYFVEVNQGKEIIGRVKLIKE